ncbi:MAG: esterase/lipase family protein [Candidatus Hodarchaeales archaeon]|jgi:hypothetical protein
MMYENEDRRTGQAKFVDVTPETERLKELDHFWIEIEKQMSQWRLWRFAYLDTDTTETYLPDLTHARFNEPILLIHGFNSQHTIFNWFARELWRHGFRYIFAFDISSLIDLDVASTNLAKNVKIIKEITNAHKISVIAHASGGVLTRYYAKFQNGAAHIRVLAMIGSPHDKTQYIKLLQNKSEATKNEVEQAIDYFEDISSTISEKELYFLTQINIGGSVWSTSKDGGTIRFIPLPDAVNISVGDTQLRIHKHRIVFRLVQPFLIPQIAIFKIRLLTLVNLQSPISLWIHSQGRLTQQYPRQGFIAPNQEIAIPENPMIIYTNQVELNRDRPQKLIIHAFENVRLQQKKIGRLEVLMKIDSLPHVEYLSLVGEEGQRIDFAVYAYIP